MAGGGGLTDVIEHTLFEHLKLFDKRILEAIHDGLTT